MAPPDSVKSLTTYIASSTQYQHWTDGQKSHINITHQNGDMVRIMIKISTEAKVQKCTYSKQN